MHKLEVSSLIRKCYGNMFCSGEGTDLVYVRVHGRISRWLRQDGSIVLQGTKARFYRMRALDAVAFTLGLETYELYCPSALCIVVKYSATRDAGHSCQLTMQQDGTVYRTDDKTCGSGVSSW